MGIILRVPVTIFKVGKVGLVGLCIGVLVIWHLIRLGVFVVFGLAVAHAARVVLTVVFVSFGMVQCVTVFVIPAIVIAKINASVACAVLAGVYAVSGADYLVTVLVH